MSHCEILRSGEVGTCKMAAAELMSLEVKFGIASFLDVPVMPIGKENIF